MTEASNRRGRSLPDDGEGSEPRQQVPGSPRLRRHQPSGLRQWEGSGPPGVRDQKARPTRRPTRHPKTAPPGRRTRPPCGPGPPRPARPPGPLTRPGSLCRRRQAGRRRRQPGRQPLGPRPSHGRRLPQQRYHSYHRGATGPGTTSFRNRLAPPPLWPRLLSAA